MPDLTMSVLIDRTLLGLPALEINDHVTYYIGEQFLGGQTSWSRQQATSPFADGAATVQRTRQMVTEPVAVEVLADTAAALNTHVADLIDSFTQDSFLLTVTIDGSTQYKYRCEAADVLIVWTGPRMIAKQAQVNFQVPRQPVPAAGRI